MLVLCSDYLFKLLLIGDSGVGKSCLLLRFAVSYLLFVLSYTAVFYFIQQYIAVFYYFLLLCYHVSPSFYTGYLFIKQIYSHFVSPLILLLCLDY